MVWDTLFLVTAEMVARYPWVGQKMLAGHSVTCINALHYMYRQRISPESQLYALLEAVEWANSFLARERARPALRDLDLLATTPAPLSPKDDAVEEVFSRLPPRRVASMSRIGFEDVERARRIALAWASKTSDYAPFLQRAMSLITTKSTPEVHDFKFPLALFENAHFASKEWKPWKRSASFGTLTMPFGNGSWWSYGLFKPKMETATSWLQLIPGLPHGQRFSVVNTGIIKKAAHLP